jgi:isochorismate synthase/2-succinyl-5-enolpyruvyl-6-hydroxy-3-cyclohexene-1-carboxylate synthase/2-succinyl-6-hydroxy-2,4-cyclohexadiene-1-carboxylate synthase/O-succinylbenzoate synthase
VTAGSGVLRWEVPLPRSSAVQGIGAGFTALQWLQGQEVLKTMLHQAYFSGRHSTAPDTPGTAAAEAAAQGWGAVAGLGAAWLWQGPAGRAFDGGVMAGLQRFLNEAQPRLRVLGGSRCASADSNQSEVIVVAVNQ